MGSDGGLLRCGLRPAHVRCRGFIHLSLAGLPPLRDGGFGGDHTSPAEVKPCFLPDRGLPDALLAFEGLQRGLCVRDEPEDRDCEARREQTRSQGPRDAREARTACDEEALERQRLFPARTGETQLANSIPGAARRPT